MGGDRGTATGKEDACSRSVRPPDILWIVTTQWRGQALGAAGDPNARTPSLDALAARATCFAEAVTPHPFGPFARAALLTGVRSPENGVCDYFDPLPQDAKTFAHAMRECGYETAWFGKWHLGLRDKKAPLVGREHATCVVPSVSWAGFEFWEGFEGGFLLNDPWLHGTRLPLPVQFLGYQSDVICNRAAEWLQSRRRDRPFFCVVSLEPPHPPYDAPAADVRPRDPSEVVLRPNVPAGAALRARSEMAGYYAHIEATDRSIGRLLAALDLSSTATAFTSVHGDMHGSHGLFRKGWPYEESIRVPLIIDTPASVARVDHAAVSLDELPRMTMAIAEGREWFPAGDPVAISMPSVVELPDQGDRVWRGVRWREWKVVFGPSDDSWLVFNLRDDPYEMANLAGDPSAAGAVDHARALLLRKSHSVAKSVSFS